MANQQPPRPNLLDLRAQSQASVTRPMRSPRLHVAGEVPPELSPLDAFALQSRLLAKQLEESAREGRRMSRLPPLTTESPLIVQGRSDYFRSMSQDSGSDCEGDSPLPPFTGLGLRTEVEESAIRPRSMHPRMSQVPPTPDEPLPALPALPALPPDLRNQSQGPQLDGVAEGGEGYFGARRERSPSPVGSHASASPRRKLAEPAPNPRESSPRPPAPLHLQGSAPSQSPEKTARDSFDALGLAPPRSMFPRRSSSIMSQPVDLPDDRSSSAMSAPFHSQPPRKLSAGRASPAHFQRSPSVSSEASALPRPSFNFSRPLSRAGTPGLETPHLDMPTRQASSDSQASFYLADDSANTPISMNSEGFPDPAGLTEDGRPLPPSYIYSKFSLPRGKMLQRSTAMDAENQPRASIQWEQPVVPPSNVQTIPFGGNAPPSPPTRPSSAGSRLLDDGNARPSLERSKLSTEIPRPATRPSPNPSLPPSEAERLSTEDLQRGRPATSHEPPRGRTAMSAATSDSASTVKLPPTLGARSQFSNAPTISDMSPEEHLERGIALHEAGKLNESTYHLRHAARRGSPTGMLLYALACRHGWGMRANQREGVEWLRKAAEHASVEIAEDEDHAKEGKPGNATERKTRKAQFALSIYELGVSHMNGWGIEQDKALALRCFEIAGSWGDADALCEAGFCYAQGIGCKKNLKTSAKFYRMAEAKGMSMVGNSWIHKSKYDDEPDDKKKARSKSRPRNIFGIKSK